MHRASLPMRFWGSAGLFPPHVGSDSRKCELRCGPGEISTGCSSPDRCSCITAAWIVDGLLWRHLWFHSLSLFVLRWRVCGSPMWLIDFRVGCCWVYRFGYVKADSFCSDIRRALRRVLQNILPDMLSSLYVRWHTKGTVPLRNSILPGKVLIELSRLRIVSIHILPAGSVLWPEETKHVVQRKCSSFPKN